MKSDIDVVRSCFKAFEEKDRFALEDIVAMDFQFTSPLDNAIGRDTYFDRCWPISEHVEKFHIRNLVNAGGQVFVTYESVMKDGSSFRNTEIFTVAGEKISAIEVYFGWNLPHPALRGGFVEEQQNPAPPSHPHEPDPTYGDGSEA